jgi:hypothetical protein
LLISWLELLLVGVGFCSVVLDGCPEVTLHRRDHKGKYRNPSTVSAQIAVRIVLCLPIRSLFWP